MKAKYLLGLFVAMGMTQLALATSITLTADHQVAVYVSYGNSKQKYMQVVSPTKSLSVNTGALSQDKSKINTIVWKETGDDTRVWQTGANLDIPRVLAGATLTIKADGTYDYDFNVRGSGSKTAAQVTQLSQLKNLSGEGASDLKNFLAEHFAGN